MGESTKSVCALLLIVSGIAGALAWTADRPDTITWGFRIGGPIAAIFALGVIFKLQFRADLEHDYLRALMGTYFNRNDFCFAFVVTPYDGIAFMDAYFQTQRDKPCVGRIALRPARGFFFTRAKIDAITFEVECPPAGFGFARIAIPIPLKLQGKRQSFEVGASVRYPDGKGRRVRFHDGIFLRSNTNFGNSFGTALTVAGTATGSIALSQPATATIDLPVGVAEDLPDNIAPEIKILWQLGEPPLENVS
ncbi:hypothetical protein CA11_37070 [Gimesia maris]|uniref:hypothetical protein n=1 Tax=Gimesia maris TaxID=122 RepID=UPI00118A391C|nr:hypothetical protein [Gimesia maris]QDU15879.1 hypothetical protein CA11_37070 [Gimesia maris]